MRISDWSSDVCSSDLQRRAAAYGLMVDDRGQAAVGVDPPIFGRQMIALEHVHREQLMRKPDLFEHDRDLVAVRRGGEINVDHAGFPSAKMARAAAKAASKDRKSTRLNSSH